MKKINILEIEYKDIEDEDDYIYEYREKIAIDRNQETFKIEQKLKNNFNISHLYEFEDGYEIIALLDDIKTIEPIIGKAELDDTKKIIIRVKYNNNEEEILHCAHTRPNLPKNWEYITSCLSKFIEDKNDLTLLLPVCGITKDEVKLASVYFENNPEQIYDYIDEVGVAEGDVVSVPVGSHSKEAKAIVVETNIYNKDETPLPLNKYKKIKDAFDNIYY